MNKIILCTLSLLVLLCGVTKKIIKVIMVFLAFLVVAFIVTAAFSDQTKWVGVRSTGKTGDAILSVDMGATSENIGIISDEFGCNEILKNYTRNGTLAGKEYNGDFYFGVANRIYKYNGITTELVATHSEVLGYWDMEVYRDKLYAVGYYGAFNDKSAVYEYDGSTWQHSNLHGATVVYDMTVFGEHLWAVGGSATLDAMVYKYDGNKWETNYTNDTSAAFFVSIESYGDYLIIGQAPNGHILRYNSSDASYKLWYDSDATSIYSLEIYDGDLYAGGDMGKILKYDGQSWTTTLSTGLGAGNTIRNLKVYNQRLYASVSSYSATPTSLKGGIYRYDGNKWETVFARRNILDPLLQIYMMEEYNGKLLFSTYETTAYPNHKIYEYQDIPPQYVILSDVELLGPISVNITNYGFKEYTTTITSNGTNISDISFNGLMEHLIIQPNLESAVWRFKLTDENGYVIYDGSKIDQTGRLGLIVDLPLIGKLNTTIQNVTVNDSFRIKVVYT